MSQETGAFDAMLEVLSAAEADRVTALYAPLADAVRELVDATIRTEADDDVVANARTAIEAVTRQLRHAHQVQALHNTSTLESLDAAAAADLVPAADVELLRHAWLTATRARNALVLVRGRPTDQLPGPGRQLNAVAVAAGWRTDDGSEFLDNYLRVTRRAKAVVRKVFGS